MKRVVSPTIPYLACAALLTLGTWILYKAVTHFLHPGTTEMQRYVQLMVGGTLPEARPAEGWTLFLNSFGLAALIAGTSLAARLPRLALGMKFRAVGAWIIGAELYVIFVDGASAEAIGQGVCRHLEKLGVAQWAEARGWRLTAYELAILATLLGSLLVAGIALWATRRASGGLRGHAERRLRCFFKGSRPLLLLGAALIALFVLSQVPKDHPAAAPPAAPPAPVEERVRRKTAPLSPEERQAAAQKRAADERKAQATLKALEVSPPVWPVVLSSAAFFYLWWLALLLFDLAFVWNRYVRQGVALERLRSWKPLGATATANPKARCARWSKEDGRSGKPAATCAKAWARCGCALRAPMVPAHKITFRRVNAGTGSRSWMRE